MRHRILKFSAATAVILVLSGCQVWQEGGSTFRTRDGKASLHVPNGWMFTSAAAIAQGDMLATRDGVLLQRMVLEHHELEKPLALTKRKLTPALSPYELAEAVVDDLRSNRELSSFEVHDNSPATVGGRPGFRLVTSFRVPAPEGLRVTEIRYGTIVGERLYTLRFTAPTRHYFERDLAIFESAAQTLQLGAK